MNITRNKYKKRNYNLSVDTIKLKISDKYYNNKEQNKNNYNNNEIILNNTKEKFRKNYYNNNNYEITKSIDIAYKRKSNRKNGRSVDTIEIIIGEIPKHSGNYNNNNFDKEKIRYKYRKVGENDEYLRLKLEEGNNKYRPNKSRNMSTNYISGSDRSLKNRYDKIENNDNDYNNIEKDFEDYKYNNKFEKKNYEIKNNENEKKYKHNKKNNFRIDNRKKINDIYENMKKPYYKKNNFKYELIDENLNNSKNNNDIEPDIDYQKNINYNNKNIKGRNKNKKDIRYKSLDKGLEENRLKKALKEIERVNAERNLKGDMLENFNKVLEDNYDFKEDIFFKNLINTDMRVGDLDSKFIRPISHTFKEIETKEIVKNFERTDDLIKKYTHKARLIDEE